jgi:hypothetical protein
MRFTFVAKLVGVDGQIVSRGFAGIPEAIAWLQNDGLVHLGGIAARGEVRCEGRQVVWAIGNIRRSPGLRRPQAA